MFPNRLPAAEIGAALSEAGCDIGWELLNRLPAVPLVVFALYKFGTIGLVSVVVVVENNPELFPKALLDCTINKKGLDAALKDAAAAGFLNA